jgi:hypothetical protein
MSSFPGLIIQLFLKVGQFSLGCNDACLNYLSGFVFGQISKTSGAICRKGLL